MSSKIHAVLVADSRSNYFQFYSKPLPSVPYKTHYIVKRGGTIETLQINTLDLLNSTKIPSNAIIIFKLDLGINNILKCIPTETGYFLQHEGTDEAIQRLIEFRNQILRVRPRSLVRYITIPPAHLDKYHLEKKFPYLISQQRKHLTDITNANKIITNLNQTKPSFVPLFPHTTCWDTDILTSSKIKKRKGTFRSRNTKVNAKTIV